ncbi:sensor histidine kinase [Dactylosporangium sp. CA-139066]|uniref:sensor histidine kinase n=1 Tax=Dactylosporangium sp. CA-139066 TaxID=3239930 RepID=UPI003D8CDCD8
MRSTRWSTRRPPPADLLLAGALAALCAAGTAVPWAGQHGRGADLAAAGLAVLAALPLAVRRAWPLGSLLVTAGATTVYLARGYPYGLIFAALAVAVYTAASRLPWPRSLPAGAAALAPLAMHAAMPGGSVLGAAAASSAWVVVPFAVGWVVRTGRESAALGQAEQARRFAYEERLRIAQEVHDVVGHGLAAITMQAEVALHVLPKRPQQAEAALTAISRTGKEALDELRATLAVVRRDEDDGPVPRPELARLDEFVARMAGAGVAVSVEVTGTPRRLPAAVDLAAYRIVQEALTNVLRHAGSPTATVRLDHRPGRLLVEVTDEGRGAPAAPERPGHATSAPLRGGHGIAGMRERAIALGGELTAGRRPGGGFRVAARLPVPEPTP